MTSAPAEELTGLSARQLLQLLQSGKVSAEAVTAAHLARIAAMREPEVRAWRFLDPEHALRQARQLDAARRAGEACGPLFGLPVGIKDIVDTADMPTECGSRLLEGRRPPRDAAILQRLRAAGAVIMGKTVTTEFAYFSPGPTRNPHDLARTPGGSSSGSAAAVADRMVPLAIGSQTNGSVIRPASFCGIVGIKPSHGLIPRTGICLLSAALDHVGVFARDLADAGLLLDVLAGADGMDPDCRPTAHAGLAVAAVGRPALPPDLALVHGPGWAVAEPGLIAAFEELGSALAGRLTTVDLPASFADVIATHRTVMAADMAHNLAPYWRRGWDALSVQLQGLLSEGREIRALDYLQARQAAGQLRAALDPLFGRYDAILTPAAPGEAPIGQATGNPACNGLWTLMTLPAITLPLLQGPAGMPLGVQLVGPFGADARLARIAAWLVDCLGKVEEGTR